MIREREKGPMKIFEERLAENFLIKKKRKEKAGFASSLIHEDAL